MPPTGRLLALVLGVSILLVAALAPAAGAASPPSPASAEAALDAALARVVARSDGPPGAAALVQRGSSVRFLTRGVANLKTGARIRPSDHLRTASTGKAEVINADYLWAANASGTRSIVVSANTQLSADVLPKTFKLLRSAFQAGVCAALAR